MYFELLSLPTSVNGNSVSAYHALGEMWGVSRKIEKPFYILRIPREGKFIGFSKIIAQIIREAELTLSVCLSAFYWLADFPPTWDSQIFSYVINLAGDNNIKSEQGGGGGGLGEPFFRVNEPKKTGARST
jgi:hypothetical protein